jgi:hypothetical protein
MPFEPTPEDMAAAKRDGDLVEMLLAASGRTRKKAKAAEEAAAPAPVGFGPLHRTGSWPFGINPPGPNTCHPDCGCAIKPRPPDRRGP